MDEDEEKGAWVRIRWLGEGLERPPRRALRAELTLNNPTDHTLWFVLPMWLDEPLSLELPEARRIECLQDESGQLHLAVYAEPPALLFPVAPRHTYDTPVQELVTWGETTSGEIWIAEGVRVPGWGELDQQMATGGELAPPTPRPEGPALLASVELPPGSRLAIARTAVHPFGFR